jgi:hypothetical protein
MVYHGDTYSVVVVAMGGNGIDRRDRAVLDKESQELGLNYE